MPTAGPTVSALMSVTGPATVFSLSHEATAGESPGVAAAASTLAKRPVPDRVEMIDWAIRSYSTPGFALARAAIFSGSSRWSIAESGSAPLRFRSKTPGSRPFGKSAVVSAFVTSRETSRPSRCSIGTRRRTWFLLGLVVALDRRDGDLRPLHDLTDPVLVGLRVERVDDLRPAGEVDAPVEALRRDGPGGDDGGDDRADDEGLLEPDEVEFGVLEQPHGIPQIEMVSTFSRDP